MQALYRWGIINHLIKQNNYKSYLEVGYYKGWSFDRVDCDNKTAVDPNPSKDWEQEELKASDAMIFKAGIGEDAIGQHILYKTTSDRFFDHLNKCRKYDIVFIDGLHESEQVLRDIQNSLKCLKHNGVIVMHDCNPTDQRMTQLGAMPTGEWTGDVYKAFLAATQSIADGYVVNTDYGVGILRPKAQTTPILVQDITWDYFNQHRYRLLNLTSIEDFLKKETK